MRTTVHSLQVRFGLLILFLALGGLSTLEARFIEHKERHLGPTGMTGKTSPKDITVTKIAEGSPADGKVKVGDVIVAAGGVPFKDQTRKQLAGAIDEAESTGVLKLKMKDGREVDLAMEKIGSFSDTAPLDCPKTDAMITRAADHLVASGKFGRGDMNIGLLGLLATGEEKYIKVVRDVLHQAAWAKPDVSLSLDTYARTAWGWGYQTLLLAEYYLLTGDEYVKPALKTYATAIAKGRDAAGLWGHGMATYDLNGGQPHGRLPGYAVMNQSSLPCFLSVLLADKAGIKDPEITACIEQTSGFYREFIGKGTLPYGVHDPNMKSYNNNGMSGLAAVAFGVQQDKRGARFFSRMSAASHNTMETGHTGHFFNQMWTGLGANLAGPETTVSFFGKTRWLHIMNRTWDGGYVYDCSGYPNAIFSYRGLSDTGSHLLNLCLGRKKLVITGRELDESLWLKGSEVDSVISLADLDVKLKSDEELLALFGHEMPKVRVEALWTLRARDHKLGPAIRELVTSGDGLARETAIGYYGYGCEKEKALTMKDALASILRNPEESFAIRGRAAYSLCWMGPAAYPVHADMLKLLVADKPSDPLQMIDKEIGRSLVILAPNPYEAGLVKDKALFYSAVEKLLSHKRSDGRDAGMKLIAHMPIEDFPEVGERVAHIIADQDRTYHSYHNMGAKTEAIGLLGSLNIEGGMEAAMATLDEKTGKYGFKIRMLMAVLPKYGSNAKPLLPKLKEMAPAGRFEKPWAAMIKSIEEAPPQPEMLTMEEAMKAGK
ncbi:MAG: DUF6288 domain-containing protein [Haloferula sp.]